MLVTMDGAQGVEMLKLCSPRIAIPIHYNDYTVFRSPLSDFQKAVDRAGMARSVRYFGHGDTDRLEVPFWDRRLKREA